MCQGCSAVDFPPEQLETWRGRPCCNLMLETGAVLTRVVLSEMSRSGLSVCGSRRMGWGWGPRAAVPVQCHASLHSSSFKPLRQVARCLRHELVPPVPLVRLKPSPGLGRGDRGPLGPALPQRAASWLNWDFWVPAMCCAAAPLRVAAGLLLWENPSPRSTPRLPAKPTLAVSGFVSRRCRLAPVASAQPVISPAGPAPQCVPGGPARVAGAAGLGGESWCLIHFNIRAEPGPCPWEKQEGSPCAPSASQPWFNCRHHAGRLERSGSAL